MSNLMGYDRDRARAMTQVEQDAHYRRMGGLGQQLGAMDYWSQMQGHAPPAPPKVSRVRYCSQCGGADIRRERNLWRATAFVFLANSVALLVIRGCA